MSSETILVTGGAGYIGSHCLRHLLAQNYRIVVIDNLSSGHRWAIPESVEFCKGDAGDAELVSELIDKYSISAVVHFAGSIVAPESVDEPLKYYANNTGVCRAI